MYQLTKSLTVNCLSANIQRFWALLLWLQQLQRFCVEQGSVRSQSLWTGRKNFMPGASRSESVCTFQSLRIKNTLLVSGLPLPRVTCAPGFVDTNLTLEHKTTKVESVRKKNLQKNVPLTKFVPTKVSGFYNLCFFLCFFLK